MGSIAEQLKAKLAALEEDRAKKEAELKTPSGFIRHMLQKQTAGKVAICGKWYGPGDVFDIRRGTGTYYERRCEETGRIIKDGDKMTETGPFTFYKLVEQGDGRRLVHAFNKDGAFCVLNIGPEFRSSVLPSIVHRPYELIPSRKKKKQNKLDLDSRMLLAENRSRGNPRKRKRKEKGHA